jgi:hypothetical protein
MLSIQKTDRMITECQRNADYWTGTEEIDYPHFDAWQSDNPADNCWCLNISLSADQEPIEVRGLHSPRAVEEFAAGFQNASYLQAANIDNTIVSVSDKTEPLTFQLYVKFIKDNIRLHRQKWAALWGTLFSRTCQPPDQDAAVETTTNQRENAFPYETKNIF